MAGGERLDPRAELSEFLRTRRARRTPADVGLAEHAHLLHLAKPMRHRRRPAPQRQPVRAALSELLTAMEGVPAYIWGRRTDVPAWNRTASAVFGDWTARAPQDRNWARITFLDPASRELFVDWDAKAADVVGQLRLDAGQHPNDPLLAALAGEFTVRYETFALATHQELALSTYHAEPGSASEQALRLVASQGADAALITGK
jgi:hypothetical protein